MLGEGEGIVEVVPRAGHGEAAGGVQHARGRAGNGTEGGGRLDGGVRRVAAQVRGRRRLPASLAGSAGPAHVPQILYAGQLVVPRVHHVARRGRVVRVQRARVHQSSAVVQRRPVVAVGGGIHLGPVVRGCGGCGCGGRLRVRGRRGGGSGGGGRGVVLAGDSRARGDGRPLVLPVGVLLHVLGQVGLLRVALSAVLTDVRLEVFALLVLGDVFEEGGLVGEALVAGVALVRLVRLVAPGVRLQVG